LIFDTNKTRKNLVYFLQLKIPSLFLDISIDQSERSILFTAGGIGTYYPIGAPDVIPILVEGFPEHLMLYLFLWRGSRSTCCYSCFCGGVPGAPDVIPVLVEGFPEHLMLFPFVWRGSQST
jgi:hypothetical protein